MILWRIANKDFTDVNGIGGLHCSGRWHTMGRPIVYFAEHPALAMLEVRVNMDIEARFLTKHVMMQVSFPDNIKIAKINNAPFDENICQKLGDTWLEKQKTSLCRVRSILSPNSYNYLFNPLHEDASKIKILNIAPFAFDARLFD